MKTSYTINIHSKALLKIKEVEIWYNNKQDKLGTRFKNIVVKQIDSLATNPKIYAIKYENFRCMQLKVFPYMVHFTIDDITNIVDIYLLVGNKENPDKWGDI